MLSGTFALVERSLRVDARSRRTHLIRLALVIGIYILIFPLTNDRDLLSAPGLVFFQGIARLDAFAMTLIGIGLFSSVITEEKEEDSLGLMLMAGISPLGILTGKSAGGLCQTMLLIVIQIPFSMLAITLGGVTHYQVLAVMFALLAYTLFLAGVGLLCSTISSTNKLAAWVMAFLVGIYFVLPIAMNSEFLGLSVQNPIDESEITFAASSNLLEYCQRGLIALVSTNIYYQLGHILSTGANEPVFSIQAVRDVIMGFGCVGLAWMSFDVSTRQLSSEAITRGTVARRPGLLTFAAGRVWSNPFIWKDFYFVSGGVWMSLVRVAFFIALALIPWISELLNGNAGHGNFFRIPLASIFSVFLIVTSTSIMIAMALARSMQDEIRGQTLPSLIMMPHSTKMVVYSKYAGALLGTLPCPLLGSFALFSSSEFRGEVQDMLNNLTYFLLPEHWFERLTIEALFHFSVLVSTLFLSFALTPHFAALLALHMRSGATLVAIGLTCAVVVFPTALVGSLVGFDGFLFIPIIFLAICVRCHFLILRRVEELAAR